MKAKTRIRRIRWVYLRSISRFSPPVLLPERSSPSSQADRVAVAERVLTAERVAEGLDDALGPVDELVEAAQVQVDPAGRGRPPEEPSALRRGRPGVPVEVDPQHPGRPGGLGQRHRGGGLGQGDLAQRDRWRSGGTGACCPGAAPTARAGAGSAGPIPAAAALRSPHLPAAAAEDLTDGRGAWCSRPWGSLDAGHRPPGCDPPAVRNAPHPRGCR